LATLDSRLGLSGALFPAFGSEITAETKADFGCFGAETDLFGLFSTYCSNFNRSKASFCSLTVVLSWT